MVVTPKEEEKVNSMFSSVVKKEQPAETVATPQQEDAAKDKFERAIDLLGLEETDKFIHWIHPLL